MTSRQTTKDCSTENAASEGLGHGSVSTSAPRSTCTATM